MLLSSRYHETNRGATLKGVHDFTMFERSFFFAVPRQDAREETEAGEHEALEDQAELEGIPRAQSFLGDHVEGAETDGECFLNFPTLSHSLSPC